MPCQHVEHTELKFVATDYISGDEFDVVTCQQCGLTVTQRNENEQQAVSPIDDTDYYPEDYYGEETRYRGFLGIVLNFLVKRRVAYLGTVVQQTSGDILDIGCGQGELLNYFHQRGWACVGVEANEVAAHHASKILGLNILLGLDKLAQLPDDSFDVICLWHVLEHLEDPEAVLVQVRRLLKPTGKFLLSVPNFSSWEARLAKDKWFHLDVPRHIIHFTEEQLMKHIKKAGLTRQKVSYFVPEYDFYSFIQSVQNSLGLQMNLLYRCLRSGELDTAAQSKRPSVWQTVVALLSLPILVPLSLIWVTASVLCKQGSSIVVVLKKADIKAC